MAVTRTFSIIKPDATRRNLTGAVTKMLEDAGLRGLGITFISAGLMSVAFMMFSGIQL